MTELVHTTANVITEHLPYLSIIWEKILSIANSNFTAALAGALAGALTAQRIAERGKAKDELLKELHSVNSAIALSASCVSLAAALKKQHINRLKKSYDEDLVNFEKHKEDINSGKTKELFTLNADLRTLNKISPPITTILDIVMNRLSMAGRGIAAAAALSDYVENLNDSLANRNEIINAFKNNQFPNGASFEHLYLGIPYGNNQTNKVYGDTLSAIHLYTNDVIFFSVILCEDLQDHATTLNKLYRKKFRGPTPKSSKVDFSQARNNGLIPPDIAYEPWLAGFPRDTPENLCWWQRFLSKFQRREA